MKLAYVIGPYRAPTINQIVENIAKAEAVAKNLWKAGFAVICPHKNSALLDGVVSDIMFLAGTMEMLERCDFAVTVEGWKNSSGSKAEVEKCKKLGIPLYHSIFEVVSRESGTGTSNEPF